MTIDGFIVEEAIDAKSFPEIIKEYCEYKMSNQQKIFDKLHKILKAHDIHGETTISETEWLKSFYDLCKTDDKGKIDFKNRMLLFAELALAAYNATVYKEKLEKSKPVEEAGALRDILWLRSNFERVTEKREKVLRIIQFVFDASVRATQAWEDIVRLVGYNIFDREFKRESAAKEVTTKLFNVEPENYSAIKILFGHILNYVLIDKIPKEVMRELQSVVNGKLQAALVLGDLTARFPKLFPKPS